MSRLLASLLALALITVIFPSNSNASEQTPLPVIVSIAPQKYMLDKIAGDRVSVTVLVKPGADPHSYEPTPAQMRQCASAAFYFSIGVPFEYIWLPRIEGAAKKLKIVSIIRDIQRVPMSTPPGHQIADGNAAHHEQKTETLHSHTSESKNTSFNSQFAVENKDPHVWLSPQLVKKMLPPMVEALVEALPEHAEEFRNNAAALAKELDSLHAELETLFAPVPQASRVFLTFHPSWGYFSREFGLTELSIEVEGKEPGPKAMQAIITVAREHKLTTIFVEPQFPTAAATAIAGNLNAKVARIDPLAENLPDSLRTTAKALLESFPH